MAIKVFPESIQNQNAEEGYTYLFKNANTNFITDETH